jgi:hypothetical protein
MAILIVPHSNRTGHYATGLPTIASRSEKRASGVTDLATIGSNRPFLLKQRTLLHFHVQQLSSVTTVRNINYPPI